MSAPANIQILGDIEFTSDIAVDPETGVATFTFTMPTASVLVTPAFQKISTLYFDPADRTNLMEIKVGDDKVNVKDSKTVKIDKVEGVIEGTPVKLTANTGYKFRKVEAKKGAADVYLTVGNITLLITGCTTWEQVIAKNSDKIKKSLSDDVEPLDGSAFLRKDTDTVKITHTVYPNATDYNWYEM
jgi:hypothetical protein